MNDVEEQWQFVLRHPDKEIQRIAEVASSQPKLRQLFPYSSLRNLRFSRAVTYPYDPMPYILTVVPGERYELRAADNRPLLEGGLQEVVLELARII